MATGEHADSDRRDFLYIATGAVGAVGVALTAWPFINQMNPDASVLALANVDVDLGPIAEGQSVTIKWRVNPVFVSCGNLIDLPSAVAWVLALDGGYRIPEPTRQAHLLANEERQKGTPLQD